MIAPVIGFLSGILGGMGIGGGMLLVPGARMFLHINQHSAQSLNLLCFIPSALCAICVHIKKKNIDFKSALPIIITGIPTSLMASYISANLSGNFLSKCFGAFLFVFGIKEIISGIRKNK
jgi:uncharacterized membrane protein YfcA